ncbi:MAG: hypothetical protein JWP81_588 [Ferruginibacter sp.]|nr:hypothetical protein [Ferruginibacter sp.]
MSNCTTAIRLINSLSPSEKRHFRLATRKQAGKKDYLLLFDIINSSRPGETTVKKITESFLKRGPESSIDATSRYLIKIITDRLIASKTEKDNEFNLFQSLLRVKVLQERSLQTEAYKDLKKIRDLAISSQHHIIQYMTFRMELNHLSDQRFAGIKDNYLVEMQMRAKETLRNIQNIEAHHALYELIKYRLTHLGRIVSDNDKKKLNDLLLSEISLVTGKVKTSFESRKLHLLFQSFYFTDIADHRSALKSFHELNRLFEQNPNLHDHPPIDYFSALEGILDSLRTVRQYEQVSFYINKLEKIDTATSPEYFRFLLKKTIAIYTLSVFIGEHDFIGAVDYIHSMNALILTSYHLVHIEKQAELHFYCALAYFGKKDFKKAHKYLQVALTDNRDQTQQVIYKAIRLLNIIIYYELKDMDYLHYEIRSYTRSDKRNGSLTKCEKLIFKTIKWHPLANSTAKNKLLMKKIIANVQAIRNDKYEGHLIKYMDFPEWSMQKFQQQISDGS